MTDKNEKKNIVMLDKLKGTAIGVKGKASNLVEDIKFPDMIGNTKESIKKKIEESTNSIKESKRENKELNQALKDAIARYDVTYISGLSEYPNAKLGNFIGLNVMPDKFSFRKTSTSKKWFADFDISYDSILEVDIEKRTVSTVEMILDFQDGINHEQETVICIVYQNDAGEELTLRIEMFTGMTIYRQAAKCREFMALLRQHGILKRIEEKKNSDSSKNDVLRRIKEIASLMEEGILTEEEFQDKKKALLAEI